MGEIVILIMCFFGILKVADWIANAILDWFGGMD